MEEHCRCFTCRTIVSTGRDGTSVTRYFTIQLTKRQGQLVVGLSPTRGRQFQREKMTKARIEHRTGWKICRFHFDQRINPSKKPISLRTFRHNDDVLRRCKILNKELLPLRSRRNASPNFRLFVPRRLEIVVLEKIGLVRSTKRSSCEQI